MTTIPSIIEQLIEGMGFSRDAAEKLMLRQNKPWIQPFNPGFTSRHPVVNAHTHPATAHLNGLFYPLSKLAQYIPCIATALDLVGVLNKLNCRYTVLKAQTCFGPDNTSLVESLKYCRENGIDARGIATIDETVTREELMHLKEACVVGVRFAFLGHLVKVENLEATKASVIKIADMIKEFGFVTNLYFEAKDIDNLKDMVLAVAERTPVTLDHMCRPDPNHPDGIDQPNFQTLLKLIEQGDGRIHVLLSGPDRATKSLDPKEWEKMQDYKMALIERFPNWVSVGTDFNHPNSDWGVPDDGKLWKWCRDRMTDAQWYLASYANPMKFFFNEDVPRFDPKLHGSEPAAPAGAMSPQPK